MFSHSDQQAQEEQLAQKTSKIIHEGRLICLVQESYRLPDKTVDADIVHHPGAVAIIPIDHQGRILLIKQWRRAIRQILIEIPAGTLEPSESPLECAQRELQEETGFKAGQIIPMGVLHTCPGFCTEKISVFLARDLKVSPLPPDDNEAIDLMPLSLEDSLSQIENGTITDAKTIAAMCFYLRWLNKNKDQP
ncbi:MAG: NUDIX hydrolase [Chlamydiae bacterium]|nr:NUDIX hydrolase [Chlamydiota bacterium]